MRKLSILILLASFTITADSMQLQVYPDLVVITDPYKNINYDSPTYYDLRKVDCVCPTDSYSNRQWYDL